jgi:hypothetical protein
MNNAVSINEATSVDYDNYITKNINTVFNELNFRITDKEISKAIQNLKINNASGMDGVLNEMLKASITTITPHINKLFNLILSQG